MEHLKRNDPQNTVIMVQPENEVGTYGSVRDFSPLAQKLFDGPAPDALLKRFDKKPGTGGQCSARMPTNISTPGTSRATSRRSQRPGKP